MGRTLIEALAEHVSAVTVAGLPGAVRARGREALLDTLGAILAGTRSETTQDVLATLRAIDGGRQAAVIGTNERLSAAGASLAVGTAAHAWEVDDFGGCGHSGAVVVPAILAAGQLTQATGARLLEALVAGYETAARITAAAGGYRAQTDRGWHTTGTCGSFGAAAGVARLLGLDAERTADALGIAGSFTGGIWAFIHDGAMTKRLHAGKAAANGLVAAYLAQHGVTGPRQVLEAEWGGFFTTYMDGVCDPEALLDGLGRNDRIFESGIKPYAACRANHFPIEAVLSMMTEHRLSDGDVERVTIQLPEESARQLGRTDIRNTLDAQMSMPFGVAVALVRGDADLEHFLPEQLDDPMVHQAMRRIDLVVDEAMSSDQRPQVELRTLDGRCHVLQLHDALGSRTRPLTAQQVRDKFVRLTVDVLPEDRVKSLLDSVERLETLDRAAESIADLTVTG